MNRRESLKVIGLTTLSAGLLLEACQPQAKETQEAPKEAVDTAGREPKEIERNQKLNAEKFFTDEEMATITVLVDIIIPKDAHSGSASEAKVPDYIEFVVKDEPGNQVPLRGGLRWLDLQSLERYGKTFVQASQSQQIEIIDQIAYPGKATPDMEQGVAFFNRLRNLTASGFYTTEMGIRDLGYMGNHPGPWNGVPEDIIKQYGLEGV
jgi:hypothetical protein